jgi:hypothetical protein
MATNPGHLDDALDPSRYERIRAGRERVGSHHADAERDPDPVTQDVLRALNIDSWMSGLDMSALETRMEHEIELAVRNEEEIVPLLREKLKRDLASAPGLPRGAGLYSATPPMIRQACESVLFNGLVEACDGTRSVIDTLPITIVNIGIAMTTYAEKGNGSTFGQRLYRHEIRQRSRDPERDLEDFLARRQRRDVAGYEGEDLISSSDMMSRALMSYAERALLASKSTRPWRMGHGNPFAFEIFTGAGHPQIIVRGAAVLTELFGIHKKALFVPSDLADRGVKTIAASLRPGEYAILLDCRHQIERYLAAGTETAYNRQSYREAKRAVERLRNEIAGDVVLGVYKATALSPGHIFYTHLDHVHEAALIALADSALRENRGFPNLIDLADTMCRTVFDNASLTANVKAVLARANTPFGFLAERSSRT